MKNTLAITTLAVGLALAATSSQASLTFAGINNSQLAFAGAVNLANLSSTTVGSITYQQSLVAGGGTQHINDGVNALTGSLASLQPHTQSNGSDGIANSPNVTSIPEPSTVVAGAMLLLPFSIGTWRTLRQRQQAAAISSPDEGSN